MDLSASRPRAAATGRWRAVVDHPPGQGDPTWGYQRIKGELLRLGVGSQRRHRTPGTPRARTHRGADHHMAVVSGTSRPRDRRRTCFTVDTIWLAADVLFSLAETRRVHLQGPPTPRGVVTQQARQPLPYESGRACASAGRQRRAVCHCDDSVRWSCAGLTRLTPASCLFCDLSTALRPPSIFSGGRGEGLDLVPPAWCLSVRCRTGAATLSRQPDERT